MATATLKAKLTLNDTAYQAGLRKAVTLAKTAGAKIKGALSAGLKLGAGAGALGAVIGGAALAKGIKGAYDMGDALADLRARTGVTAEALITLQRAFADNGLEASAVGGVVNKMQKAISEAAGGSKAAAEAFGELGLNIRELKGMSADAQLAAIGKAINGVTDETDRAAAAMKIFGRSGGELLALFADDNAIGSAKKSMSGMAGILARNVDTFAIISDRLARVGVKFEGFMVGVASKFAPAMLAVTAAIERTDFAAQGERFGAAMQKAAEIFAGIWENPSSTLEPFANFMESMWAKAANFMVAAFKRAFNFVAGHMLLVLNKVRAVQIAGFEEFMSKIPGSGYDKSKTFEQRVKDTQWKGAGKTLGLEAAKLFKADSGVKDVFGSDAAMQRAKSGVRRIREAGREAIMQSANAGATGTPWVAPPQPSLRRFIPSATSMARNGLGGGAYDRIRRGDAARAKATKAGKDPVETTNDLLEQMLAHEKQVWGT